MKNRNKKSILFCFIMISLLCIGCKPKYTGEDYEAIHTCEAVEDITQEEIVSFENILIDYSFSQSIIKNYELTGYCYPVLCVFNDGSVYCMVESYEKDSVTHLYEQMDESIWETMGEIYYLGRLSGEDLFYLTYYLSKVDVNSEYYYNYPIEIVPNSWGNNMENTNWNSCGCSMMYHNENGGIQWSGVQGVSNEGDRIRISYQILDRDALKAMDILTESWFYEKWLELVFAEAE